MLEEEGKGVEIATYTRVIVMMGLIAEQKNHCRGVPSELKNKPSDPQPFPSNVE